jgi:hypothetical protein
MIRKFLKLFTEMVSVLVVMALLIGVGYYYGTQSDEPETVVEQKEETSSDLKLPGEVEKEKVTVADVDSKLAEIEELSTYSGDYTVTLGKEETRYMLDKLKIPGTTNSIEITATGIVKVGYDVAEMTVKVDDDTIYIGLPAAQVYDNYIIWDSLNCTESNTVLNPIEFSQYQEIISEMEAMGLEDVEEKDIYGKAEEHFKTIINGFLSEFKDYEIEYM